MNNKVTSTPIFVLGSGRSGTSILTAALRSGAGIPGFGEGHFLPLLTFLVRELDRYFRGKETLRENEQHMISHIKQRDVENEIIAVFKKRCEGFHHDGVWLDKTPTAAMIKAVPHLNRAWPEARYIFAKRRGIENIISRLKKFPHVEFEGHCKQWADCMKSWLEVKELIVDYSIEVDQRDIALHPEETAMRVGELLALSREKVVKISNTFSQKRPQSTGSEESEKAMEITETGWTSEQIEIFRKHCGEVSAVFGYTETSDYSDNFKAK